VSAGRLELQVEPRVPIHLGVGTGYGFDPEWRHGKYAGDLMVQERQWDLRTEEGRAGMWGIVDSSARFTLSGSGSGSGEGQVGYGLFEYLMI
jgi:hypothetical protein